MSNTSFQERLQRISATTPQPMVQGSGQGRPGKVGIGRIGMAGAAMVLGLQIVKLANENYEAIRDSHGLAAVAGTALVGMVIGLTGIVLIIRACFKTFVASAAVAEHQVGHSCPVRKPSKAAQVLFSLMGFAFGVISCLGLAVAAAARVIETEQAHAFSSGSILVAFSFALVSVLIGLSGLFARGRGLLRVPVYFMFGWILAFVTFRMIRVNLLEWEPFTSHFQ
ncbi:hypothetical protein G5B31_04885 [Rhodobacter sp. SGA-6-6]|uniref:hypothetical protein n=1 Tax=Rhodobacter sp. SGA-6-6 TaxID=2710882 RepID=UPI0013EBAB20|nr:hypothetical protein [Rhodobacter sp. SGA-6-6]NGM44865.1 hypothetical protein [Rhodobacter sp. SGA-6-6]